MTFLNTVNRRVVIDDSCINPPIQRSSSVEDLFRQYAVVADTAEEGMQERIFRATLIHHNSSSNDNDIGEGWMPLDDDSEDGSTLRPSAPRLTPPPFHKTDVEPLAIEECKAPIYSPSFPSLAALVAEPTSKSLWEAPPAQPMAQPKPSHWRLPSFSFLFGRASAATPTEPASAQQPELLVVSYPNIEEDVKAATAETIPASENADIPNEGPLSNYESWHALNQNN